MIRACNFMVQSRLAPAAVWSPRFYTQSLSKEKNYILKIKGETNKLDKDSQISQKFRENENAIISRRNVWERFVEGVRPPLLRVQQGSIHLIKGWKLQEKLLEFKDSQISSFNKKINDPEMRLMISEMKSSVITAISAIIYRTPGRIVTFSKLVVMEAVRYWEIFLKSEFRAKSEKTIIWTYTNSKLWIINVSKFINEAFFDKPTKSKHGN